VKPEDLAQLGELLLGQRVIALGVVADGAPIVGLLPYAVSETRDALYVQASRLARHSRGLLAGAPWSGLVHEPDTGEMDPLRIPRLQLEGVVEPLAGQHSEFQAAARTFLTRFPQAAATLQLGDFGLYRLELRGGRMVLGFGQALNLSREHFEGITRP
jgi:putative heme iron utilization protein